MTEFLGRIYSWLAFIPKITLGNLFEILIISFLIYEILIWVQNTRAWVLLKGGLMILAFYLGASLLRLNTITWMINHMGYTDKTVNEIVRAAYEMGKVKTGALIVIERETPLSEIERTGIEVDGIVTSQLLINIFEHNTPLHDGAVIIRGNRVTAATCYLPLSDNLSISKDLGTRHRAALGISETSDSLTVVVSEETGRVSLARDGQLTRISDQETLRQAISVEKGEDTGAGRFRLWKGRHKNERKAE